MKKRIFILAAIAFLNFKSIAQHECGTNSSYSKDYLKNVKSHQKKGSTKVGENLSEYITYFAINVVVIEPSFYLNFVTDQTIRDNIDAMNLYYKEAGIEFYIKDNTITRITNDTYGFFQGDLHETAVINTYGVTDAINLFLTKTIATSAGNLVNGYTHLPGGGNFIGISQTMFNVGGITVPHEFGHFFGLMHTHGSGNVGGTSSELVDGSNCSSSGDYFCDTPADPNLYGLVDNSCNYTGTQVDANNATYNPPVHNVMSYSRESCRNEFTPEQLEHMHGTIGHWARTALAPTPNTPTNFVTSNVTSNSIDASWLDNSVYKSGAMIKVKNLDNGAIQYDSIVAGTNTHTFAGLNPLTNYEISIMSFNGVNKSQPTTAISFTTSTGAGLFYTFEKKGLDRVNSCGNDFKLNFNIKNSGTTTITEVVANVYIDNVAKGEKIFSGLSLLTAQTSSLVYDGITFSSSANYEVKIELISVNGVSDNSSEKSTIYIEHKNGGVSHTIVMQPDFNPFEAFWSLEDASFTVIESGDGNYGPPNVCLAEGCYKFTINDMGMDGFSGMGSYSVLNNETNTNVVVMQDPNFAFAEHDFCVQGTITSTKFETSEQKITACPNPVNGGIITFSQNVNDISIYNSLGQIVKTITHTNSLDVSDLQSGIYVLKSNEGVVRIIKH